jgi:hypothetical protein
MMEQQKRDTILRELHRSLDERWRPEDVAQKIVILLELNRLEQETVEKAAQVGRENFWFATNKDFQRPSDIGARRGRSRPPAGRPGAAAEDAGGVRRRS